MKTRYRYFIGIAVLFMVLTFNVVLSWAVIPGTVNFQGRVTDTTGAALTGDYSMTFKIYPRGRSGNSLLIIFIS